MYRFVVPDQVLDELTEPKQRAHMDEALAVGGLNVEAADSIKAELERHRFRMKFASFADVLRECEE